MAGKRLSPKQKEAKQLRRQRLEAFRLEPTAEGNILVDPPSNTITTQERVREMDQKLGEILKVFGNVSVT